MGLRTLLTVFSIFLLAAASASANCGSSYCSINTNSEVHFDAPDPGLSVNLHYEFVDLDERRAGKNKVAAQGEPGAHDELEPLTTISSWRSTMYSTVIGASACKFPISSATMRISITPTPMKSPQANSQNGRNGTCRDSVMRVWSAAINLI